MDSLDTALISTVARDYLALWNEPDAEARRDGIARLWHPDSVHFADAVEVRGHAGIAARITEVHDEFVRAGGFVFHVLPEETGHHGLIQFFWQMIRPDSCAAAAIGCDILQLDGAGRIRSDHQFVKRLPD